MLTLEGRLDTTTAPVLETELKDAIEGAASLTFDLEKLEYISSAGLRVLLATQKSMNKQGEMKVAHVGETIMEIFEVTGFSDILTDFLFYSATDDTYETYDIHELPPLK